MRGLEATPPTDLQQGYWVDCDQVVRPDNLAPGIEWLKRELPSEVAADLNWSADRTFFFLVSVLSPPTQPGEPPAEEVEYAEAESQDEGEAEIATFRLELADRAFPELADKELAVVVRARNSVVAAWLWRKYAAGTPLAKHSIWVDALPLTVRVGGSDEG